jgi:T5SS/PEP-CTERM-associated repeat protein
MKNPIVVCLSVCLCLAGVLRGDTRWTGAKSNLWSDPANWTNGVPNADGKAQFASATAPECILDVTGAQAKQLAVGDNSGGRLKLVAGSLTVVDWSIIGYAQANAGDQAGHLEVDGGVLNCQARLYIGFDGEGDLTVDNDGVVNVYNQASGIGQNKTGNGSLYLKGGTMNFWAGGASLSLYTGKAHIDFSGGTLTLTDTPQNRDTINRGIADHIITAYDGVGNVIVDTTSTAGRIVVKGLHPLQPAPVDGSNVSAGAVKLSWTLPDPCQPGKPVLADVYFGTSADFPVGGSVLTPQIIKQKNVSSVVVQTKPKTRYYWAVDTYFGNAKDPRFGPVFSFVADNLVPVVNAGNDVVTWLKNGVAAVALDATVTDDGFLQPYTVKWSVVSEPSPGMTVLTNPTTEDTMVTLKATGQYVLKLEAYDGEYTGSDTITINVYANSCEAAKSLPGYQPLPGDLNGDCVVNDADLAILQAHWLQCNALDCNDVKK